MHNSCDTLLENRGGDKQLETPNAQHSKMSSVLSPCHRQLRTASDHVAPDFWTPLEHHADATGLGNLLEQDLTPQVARFFQCVGSLANLPLGEGVGEEVGEEEEQYSEGEECSTGSEVSQEEWDMPVPGVEEEDLAHLSLATSEMEEGLWRGTKSDNIVI